jgi:exopolysaccharide biosynthesis WecB/TagA/CpsF family protein
MVFAFCNMHTFNWARRSPELAAALSKATVFNDGIGIEVASWFLFGKRFPDNLNGSDLTPNLLAALDRPTLVFLVGSTQDVAERAGAVLEARFPHVMVVGCHHGFFDAAASERLIERIRHSKPDLVLVGMGNPRQELWAIDVVAKIDAVILCVGAFLDFTAGRLSRAPKWIRTIRAEWLYRLAQEPSRLASRYVIGGASFAAAIWSEKWRKAS